MDTTELPNLSSLELEYFSFDNPASHAGETPKKVS